jgi:hypothetical protein
MVTTDLQERVLLFAFETVGTEDFKAALGLGGVETFAVALEEREDVVDGDGLEVDLLLIVKILGFELNLGKAVSK